MHLYDPAVINWRDPTTIGTYEIELVHAWNYIVHADDIVFIIGDIGRDCQFTYTLLQKLKGNKVLVEGNHDQEWDWTAEKRNLFAGIHKYILSNGMLLIHDPKDAVNFDAKWIIHGHLHNYEAECITGDHDHYIHDTHRYNCAVDMTTLHPCSFQELMYYKSLYIERNK